MACNNQTPIFWVAMAVQKNEPALFRPCKIFTSVMIAAHVHCSSVGQNISIVF